MIDLEELKNKLLKGEYSSIMIGFNRDHACNYETAQQFYDDGEYDRINWASEEEYMKAIKENSVWTIQWYPRTPVGSCTVGASTLEAAVLFILKDYCENDDAGHTHQEQMKSA